ncbi:helix-turn-helix domain-containing protein [Saccharopolyspora sp. K220]|nr:helix-turn-helix domain-containing protein [Saccharopolyspora soli]
MLAKQRESAGVQQSELGRRTHYSRISISHIEAGRQFPSRDFWKTADETCKCDGALLAEYDAVVAEENSSKIADLIARQSSSPSCGRPVEPLASAGSRQGSGVAPTPGGA